MPLFTPIPGETPIDDISGLKIKGVRTRKELIPLEAENIRKALVKYLAKKPNRRSARFDFSWSLRLHKEMLGDVWQWAGTLRTTELTIGIPPSQVETRLYELLANLKVWEESKMDLVEQAMYLHHEAVAIHPFQNGNGRWARLLANIWLKLHNHPITEWPEESVGEQSVIRSEYLAAIKKADERDYEPLLALLRRFTLSRK